MSERRLHVSTAILLALALWLPRSGEAAMSKLWEYRLPTGSNGFWVTDPGAAVGDFNPVSSGLEAVFGTVEHPGRYVALGAYGQYLWSAPSPDAEWTQASPAIVDLDGYGGPPEVLGASCSGKYVFAMDEYGSVRWSFGQHWEFKASPAALDVRADYPGPEIFAANQDQANQEGGGAVYCLSSAGQLIWTFDPPPEEHFTATTPVADVNGDGQAEVIAVSEDGTVYCLRAYDGVLLWTYQVNEPAGHFNLAGASYPIPLAVVISSPAVGSVNGNPYGPKQIIFGTANGNLYSLDGLSGNGNYVHLSSAPIASSPAMGDVDGDGFVETIVGSADGAVYCIGQYGQIEWALPVGAPVNGSPALARRMPGIAYVQDWPMFRHDPARTGFYPLQGGAVYIGSDDGYLNVIGVSPSGPIPADRFLANAPVNASPAVADLNGDGRPEVVFKDVGTTYAGATLFAVTDLGGAPAMPAQWGMRQGNAQQTGNSTHMGPSVPGVKFVRPPLSGFFTGGTAVGSDGTIYAATTDTAYAIRPDGQILTYYGGTGLCCASPAIGPDGTVHFAGPSGTTALRPPTATQPSFQLKWHSNVGICCGSVTVGPDGTIYIGNGAVYALDPTDGHEKWSYLPNDGMDCGAPAVSADGSKLYVATAHYLHVLNASGGGLVLQQSIGNFGCVVPLVAPDGTVYVPSYGAIAKFDSVGYSNGYVTLGLNQQALALAWDSANNRLIATVFDMTPPVPPAVSPTYSNGELRAMDPYGYVFWARPIEGGTYAEPGLPTSPVSASNPIVDGRGFVYLATVSGPTTAPTGVHLYAFDPGGYPAFDYFTPAIGMTSDPRLLSVDASGTLYQLANGALNAFADGYPTGPSISAMAGPDGTISPSGNVFVPYGSNVTFTLTPNAGFRVAEVLLDGYPQAPTTSLTLYGVSSFHSIQANFAPVVTLWPMRQHDAQQTGKSQYKGPMMPGLMGTLPVGLPLTGGTAVGPDGTVYAATTDTAYAIRPDGQILTYYSAALCCASPAIGPDGTIYFSGWGTVALNPDFTLKWRNDQAGICCGSVTVGPDGTIYVGNGSLLALDPADGHTKWTFTPVYPEMGIGGPAISPDGSTLYFATASTLYALNPTTLNPNGEVIWQRLVANVGAVIPVVGPDGTVYLASTAGIERYSQGGSYMPPIYLSYGQRAMALALDGAAGTLVATVFEVVDFPTPSYSNGRVFSIRLSDGLTLWSRPIEGGTFSEPGMSGAPVSSSNPIIDGEGFVYLATVVGDPFLPGHTVHLYGFDPSGNSVFDYRMAANLMSDPRLLSLDDQGTLYLLADGKLNAFGDSGPVACVNVWQPGSGGTISPEGTVCVPPGSDMTFTMTPNAGFRVDQVLVDYANVGAPTSYTFGGLYGIHNLQANFAPVLYILTPVAEAGGNILPSAPVQVGPGGGFTFNFGPSDPRYGQDKVYVDEQEIVPTPVGYYNFENVNADHLLRVSFYGPVAVTTASLPAGTFGAPYSQTLAAGGGVAPYTWAPYSGNVPLSFSPDGVLSGMAPAGTHTFTVRAIDAKGAWATRELTLVVDRADQTVTFGTLPNKTYGDLDFPVNATASSGLPVTFTATGACTVSGSSVHLTGAGSCTVTAGQAGDVNFKPASASQTFTVAQRPMTVTADAKTKVYGNADPALTCQVTGGSLVNGDVLSGSLTRLPGENVGAYPINQGSLTAGANYALTFVGANLAITQAAPVITWATPASIAYGTPLATAQLNATASTPGTFIYTPAAGEVLLPGSQTLSVAFTPTSGNYNSATKSVTLVVTQSLAVTTASPLPAGFVGAPYSQTLTASGGVAAYRWSASGLPSWLTLNATTGALSGTPPAAGTSNFTVRVTDANNVWAEKSFSLTINAARPDLTPTTVSGPTSGRRGKSIGVSATVKNQGQAKAGSFTVRFYLSTDANITTADILLGSKTVNSLNAGSSTTVSGNMGIPSTTAAGTYTIGVVVDSAGTVTETNEANNWKAGNTISVTQ